MADIIFTGLKIAYQAYQGYKAQKAELESFQDDYDELDLRVTAFDPILRGLEGNLDDELNITLTCVKNEMTKINKYIDKLLIFCKTYKTSKSGFMAVAKASLAGTAVSAFGALKGMGFSDDTMKKMTGSFEEVCERFGPPEKAFAKFAEKVTFLVTVLSAAAATQMVKKASAMANKTRPATSTTSKPAASTEADTVTAEGIELSETTEKDDEAFVKESCGLADIIREQIEDNDEEFTHILLNRTRKTISGAVSTLTFGVWLNKVPYILYIEYMDFLRFFVYQSRKAYKIYLYPVPDAEYILSMNKRINNAFFKGHAAMDTIRSSVAAYKMAIDSNPKLYEGVIPEMVSMVNPSLCWRLFIDSCYTYLCCHPGYVSVKVSSKGKEFSLVSRHGGIVTINGTTVYDDSVLSLQ